MRKLSNQQVLDMLAEAGQYAATRLNHGIQEAVGALVNIVVVIEPVGTEDIPSAVLLSASIDMDGGGQDFQGTVRRVLEKGYQQAISRPPDIVTPTEHHH